MAASETVDRNPLAAALRESDEEIALARSQVLALGYLDPFITITGFRVTPVVAVVDPAFIARPEPGEVAEVFEVPLDYLMDPANLRRGGHRAWRTCPSCHGIQLARAAHAGDATAAILYNLRRRLEQQRQARPRLFVDHVD